MKKTAIAPANIAFIKYWGKKDEALRIPTNGSISMNLSHLLTTTTVEFSKDYRQDEVTIAGQRGAKEVNRVREHLERIRNLAKISERAKVVSSNSFPASTGLSSSASGFAALTLAATKAAGLDLKERELSILARLGSGSACRSIPSGFVEWLDGDTHETSYAVSIFPPNWWRIIDVVAILSREKKEVSTTKGQKLAFTSPFFPLRLKRIKEKIKLIKDYLRKRDFVAFGELIESEALELHAIIMTQKPPLVYWLPNTLYMIREVRSWRKNGLPVYFTINTGHDLHLICEEKNVGKVMRKLKEVEDIKEIIINYPSEGARLVKTHLF